ncbi:hypothetical protein ACRAWF_33070, partial [Streptomyces sp. L7]
MPPVQYHVLLRLKNDFRLINGNTSSRRPHPSTEESRVDGFRPFNPLLEWATSCPPPRHNFRTLPRIRSESPAFDLHHPDVPALERELTSP